MKKLIAALAICGLFLAANVFGQQLDGEFPNGGGLISVTASGGDVNAAGLDFISPSGGLRPVPPGDATAPAAPFTFLLSNTANQVTYGNLGTSVTFGDGTTTELSVGANGGTGDIAATWGNVATPVAFEVAEAGGGVILGQSLQYPVHTRGRSQ